ncbi:acyl-CoA thioesterase [Aquipseudomonas alcaligenes]|uniref:Acyl-CoA thioesterase n=1 Tax=Aquipseudomonas alcaligenes TaxID=43263 RepID=A0AB73I387_AQUAC|nr:thioesterase family protein [Pseudomonas alcaligenes]MDH0144667.1 acyl-CoA thioesterase [Pseudomonas alcaligenes]
MPFITTRTILFGDCDPAGIVYTPRIAYFVIEAIHEFLSDRLDGEGLRKVFAMGILPPARALSIEFLSPMTWDEVISIEVGSEAPGTTSFGFVVEGRQTSGEVTFRASMTQVCICPESKQPTALPDALRQALQPE